MQAISNTKLWQKMTAIIVTLAMVSTMSNIQAFASDAKSDITANGGDYYVVNLGDSVTVGYGLDGVVDEYYLDYSAQAFGTRLDPGYNMHNCPTEAYPYLIAQYIYGELQSDGYVSGTQDTFNGYFDDSIYDSTDIDYEKASGFRWSNLAGIGFNSATLAYLLDDNDLGYEWLLIDDYLNHYVSDDGSVYYDHSYYRYLLKNEIAKADLVTVQIGNNDLLLDSCTDLYYLSYDIDPDTFAITGIRNYAFALAYEIIEPIALGEVTTNEQMESVIEASVEKYWDKVTVSDLEDFMDFFQADHLESYFLDKLSDTEDTLRQIQSEIAEINPDAEIVWVGGYNAYGDNLTVDGITYDFGTIMQRALSKIEEVVDEEGELDPFNDNFWDDSGWINDVDFDATSTDGEITLVSEIANMTDEQFDAIVAFLKSYAEVGDEFFIGDGASLKALAKDLDRNSLEYMILLAAFCDCSEDGLDKVLSQIESDIQYPLVHLLFGKQAMASVEELCDITERVAEDTGGVYVDISSIPNEIDVDPHPNPAGHAYIAGQIDATITEPVTVTATGDGEAYAVSETGILGAAVKVIVKPSEGQSVVSVTNNGEAVTLKTDDEGNTYFMATVDQTGANVEIVFSSNALFTLGDVNDNGVVNIVDAQLIFDMSNGGYQLASTEDTASSLFGRLLNALANGWNESTLMKAADVNANESIDAIDSRAVQNYIHKGAWK